MGHADADIIQHFTSKQLEQQLPVAASVAAPSCLTSAAQLNQELFAVLEVRASPLPSLHSCFTLCWGLCLKAQTELSLCHAVHNACSLLLVLGST